MTTFEIILIVLLSIIAAPIAVGILGVVAMLGLRIIIFVLEGLEFATNALIRKIHKINMLK